MSLPSFLQEREVLGAFVAIVLGLVLLVVGLLAGDGEIRTIGMTLLLGGVATLGVTRGLAKAGSRSGPKPPVGGVVTLLAATLLFASCGSSDCIRAASIEKVVHAVSDRHDAYVQADETLTDEKEARYLRSTEILRKVLEEATKPPPPSPPEGGGGT